MLKLKEAQAWITLNNQCKLEQDCYLTGVKWTCQSWKNTCTQRWADLSDLLIEFDIKPYNSNERALLIIENKLKPNN